MKTNINENAKSSAAQKRRILDYMMSGHSITQVEAFKMFDCFRLGARIWEIRHKDMIPVRKETVTHPVTGKRYARYSI